MLIEIRKITNSRLSNKNDQNVCGLPGRWRSRNRAVDEMTFCRYRVQLSENITKRTEIPFRNYYRCAD